MEYNYINVNGDSITLKDGITSPLLMTVKEKAEVAREITIACFGDATWKVSNPFEETHTYSKSGGYVVSDGEVFVTFNIYNRKYYKVVVKVPTSMTYQMIKRNIKFHNGILSIKTIRDKKEELLKLYKENPTPRFLDRMRKETKLRKLLEENGNIKNIRISVLDYKSIGDDEFFTVKLFNLTSADAQLLITLYKGINR